MRIVKPSAIIKPDININIGVLMLKKIEQIARISHRSEDKITNDSWERFISAVVLQKGDWSVTEHAIIGVEFVVDRGITHELVRHRIGSYTQESTRFVNYEKHMPPSFIYPKEAKYCNPCLGGHGLFWIDAHKRYMHTTNDDCTANYEPIWLDAIERAEYAYKGLLIRGWTPQEARSVFPNALASTIYVTYNLRMWRWFFLMRTTKEAHPQMREVTIPLLKCFKESIPLLFDDIEPLQTQAHNLRSLPK